MALLAAQSWSRAYHNYASIMTSLAGRPARSLHSSIWTLTTMRSKPKSTTSQILKAFISLDSPSKPRGRHARPRAEKQSQAPAPQTSTPPTPTGPRPTEMSYEQLRKDPQFKTLSRRYTGLMVGIPILAVLSYVLWQRCMWFQVSLR